MKKDLGTFYLRVELENGRGWIETWNTGHRFTDGTPDQTKLEAMLIPPTWDSEQDLLEAMVWQHTEGSFSCDCNKLLSLARAYHQPDPENAPCGYTMPLRRLTVIRPDASEAVIFDSSNTAVGKKESEEFQGLEI